jgi:hypothetical protein
METSPPPDAGYSPEISAELLLGKERFAIAALGPGHVRLKAPQICRPGRGIITMIVDGRSTVYHVDLFSGISPDHAEQPLRLLDADDEAAA